MQCPEYYGILLFNAEVQKFGCKILQSFIKIEFHSALHCSLFHKVNGNISDIATLMWKLTLPK